MYKKDFLNRFIPDRIRIVRETQDPEYIYIILKKHLLKPVESIKKDFKVTLHVFRNELTIIGKDMETFAGLFEYLSGFKLTFLSVTQDSLIVDIDDFLRIVY